MSWRRIERTFERPEWAALRAAETVPLAEEDLARIRGINDRIDMAEVEEVYLPLSRLLHLRAGAVRNLRNVTGAFLGRFGARVPFVIGVAGSVACGKSTTSRALQAVLARAPERRKIEVVTTDGFLYPNAELERRGLMERKGFPESYDTGALVRFLAELKSGRDAEIPVPLYDHASYDVLPDGRKILDRPDMVIVEGLNVLQSPASLPGQPKVFVSDFFDFSIYVDAPDGLIEKWYVDRFLALRASAFQDPGAYFHRFKDTPEDEAVAFARDVWARINLPNLAENVLPTRDRADLVLEKGPGHRVERVRLRLR